MLMKYIMYIYSNFIIFSLIGSRIYGVININPNALKLFTTYTRPLRMDHKATTKSERSSGFPKWGVFPHVGPGRSLALNSPRARAHWGSYSPVSVHSMEMEMEVINQLCDVYEMIQWISKEGLGWFHILARIYVCVY